MMQSKIKTQAQKEHTGNPEHLETSGIFWDVGLGRHNMTMRKSYMVNSMSPHKLFLLSFTYSRTSRN